MIHLNVSSWIVEEHSGWRHLNKVGPYHCPLRSTAGWCQISHDQSKQIWMLSSSKSATFALCWSHKDIMSRDEWLSAFEKCLTSYRGDSSFVHLEVTAKSETHLRSISEGYLYSLVSWIPLKWSSHKFVYITNNLS